MRVTRVITSVLLLTSFCTPVFSQTENQVEQKEKKIDIYFDHDDHEIDLDFKQNREHLEEATDLMSKLSNDSLIVDRIINISSYASPDGGRHYNKKLTDKRIISLHDYLIDSLYVPDSLIVKGFSGIDWDGLEKLVTESDMQYKAEVLDILHNVPEETWRRINPTDKWQSLVDSRSKHLMDLKGGVPYRYIFNNMYPLLRRVSMFITYLETSPPPIVEEPVAEEPEEEERVPITVEQRVEEEPAPAEPEALKNPFMAIKTNIAQLAVGVTNLGVEFKLCNKLSLDIPVTYSPYTLSDIWNLRILSVQPELRYWLKESFEGHFFGVHAHTGYYNVAVDSETRYQDRDGESPFLGCGVSYGYAHNFNDRWGMSFVAGFGFSRFDYDMFYNVSDGVKYNSKLTDYWGVTKLGINLIYKIR